MAGDASEIDCCPDRAGRAIKNRGWLLDGQAVERGWQAKFFYFINRPRCKPGALLVVSSAAIRHGSDGKPRIATL